MEILIKRKQDSQGFLGEYGGVEEEHEDGAENEGGKEGEGGRNFEAKMARNLLPSWLS